MYYVKIMDPWKKISNFAGGRPLLQELRVSADDSGRSCAADSIKNILRKKNEFFKIYEVDAKFVSNCAKLCSARRIAQGQWANQTRWWDFIILFWLLCYSQPNLYNIKTFLFKPILGPTFQKWLYERNGFNKYGKLAVFLIYFESLCWVCSDNHHNVIVGLMRDDMLHETPVVEEALRRLSPELRDERTFRIVRAAYLCLRKDILPKEQWTKLEDVSILTRFHLY